VLSLATSVFAQVAGTAQPPQRSIHNHKNPNPGKRAEVLTQYLQLDEAQQTALHKILEQRQQEVLRMRFAPLPPGGDQIDRFRAIQDRTVERIRSILNEEQRKKYDLMAIRKSSPPPPNPNVEEWLKATSPR
jgi:hypothetical protein